MRPENSTTTPTTWKVTIRTSCSWNSSQAELYQRVVKPAGSQAPNQRVPSELTATAAIVAITLTTKKITSAQIAMAHRRSATDLSCAIRLTLSHHRQRREKQAPAPTGSRSQRQPAQNP